MDALQVAIWAISLAGIIGVALAYQRSQRFAVRLGAIIGFGAFYLAVLVWGPVDQLWFGVTTVSILAIVLGSRRTTPSDDPGKEGRTND